MHPYRAPTVPAVTLAATYDCTYWPPECPECHAWCYDRYDRDASEGRVTCSRCGWSGRWADAVTEDTAPAEWGGYCDPWNPWGTADDTFDPDGDHYFDRGERFERIETVWGAAELIAEFPGAVWELETECEPSPNYRTGVDTRVTLHVDGPGGAAALELAAALMADR